MQRNWIIFSGIILVSLAYANSVQAFQHPGMGRFLQRDPAGYADGADLYEYASSRPSTSRDPTGKQTTNPSTKPSNPSQTAGDIFVGGNCVSDPEPEILEDFRVYRVKYNECERCWYTPYPKIPATKCGYRKCPYETVYTFYGGTKLTYKCHNGQVWLVGWKSGSMPFASVDQRTAELCTDCGDYPECPYPAYRIYSPF